MNIDTTSRVYRAGQLVGRILVGIAAIWLTAAVLTIMAAVGWLVFDLFPWLSTVMAYVGLWATVFAIVAVIMWRVFDTD